MAQRNFGGSWRSPGKPCRGVLRLPVHKFGVLRYPYFSTPIAVKRILRYVCGTMDLGVTLHASADTALTAYSDADWVGCPDTRRSTSGYCVYLGPSLISWSSKRQPMVSRFSAEAEYRAVANAVAECSWLRQLLQELSCPVDRATLKQLAKPR